MAYLGHQPTVAVCSSQVLTFVHLVMSLVRVIARLIKVSRVPFLRFVRVVDVLTDPIPFRGAHP